MGLPPVELDPTGIVLLVLLPVVAAIVLVTLASVLLLAVEVVVVAAAAYLWRGRWIIEATSADETRRWEVRGWSASRKKLDEVRRDLAV